MVDMPYVQATIGQYVGDCFPRWHNPAEVNAILKILSLLEPKHTGGKMASLAILSPYSQQVKRLNSAISDAAASTIPQLNHFRGVSEAGQLCHTVDSFQGSEADLIVVSLVRNNQHSNADNALGFLTDYRRMNVLLSRARWRLIIVGSFDFLKEIVNAANHGEDRTRIRFLAEMLSELSQGEQLGTVSRIPLAQLMGPS